MSAWWRFENSRGSNRDWGDIPIGPFAPDEFQVGRIFASFRGFSPGDFYYETLGPLRLIGVNVTSEPNGFAVLFIGLFGILLFRRRKKELAQRFPK